MKNFLFLAAFAAFTVPATAYAQVTYGPAPSNYEQQQQAPGGPMETYVPPMNFDFSGEEEDKRPEIVNPYSSKFKKNYVDPNEKKLPKILPNFAHKVGFIRPPGAAPGEAVLRMMTPLALSGCAHLKQPVVAIREAPGSIALRVTSTELELDKTVRYAHFQCNVRSQYAYFDLPLRRDELLEKHISRISVNSDSGQFRDIALDVNEDRVIALVSGQRKNVSAGSTPGAGGIATFWFFPENTIVLSASEKLNAEARAALKDNARTAGLVPIEEQIAGFEPGTEMANNAYFIDPTGSWKNRIGEAGKPVAFGTVSTSETYFGPNGQYQQPRNVQVYARVPGVNE